MGLGMDRKKRSRATNLVRESGVSKSEAFGNNASEGQPAEERMTIRGVVETWLRKNPAPKHIAVKGKSYDDFIGNCYQFLLAHALRHGARSTNVMVGNEDRQQIEAFLNKSKALWEKRRQEEQTRADSRRQVVYRRRHEKERRIEDLHESEIQRQAKLLQEDERRLEENQRRYAALRVLNERSVAEEQHSQEVQRQAELTASNNEQTRIEQIFSRHSKAVAQKRELAEAGQCLWADYYAFVLQDRIERSAELLFGDAQKPSYEILRQYPELLNDLKELSFGDDYHPRNYQDPFVNAYYTLRYELGYAFEYSQVYGLLLSLAQQQKESLPFDVMSIGSGQGLDYWGLRYALSRCGANQPEVAWQGVDLESWPDHVLEDGVAQYSDDVDVRDVLGGMNSLDVKVLMFPKVISELQGETIDYIISWLERVTYTRDVHYLCFAHTERKSLDPSDSKHKVAGDCFRFPSDSSLDAVKSAALISAARNGASRQFYESKIGWYDSSAMSVNYYDVHWRGGQNNIEEWTETYSYLSYGDIDIPVGQCDPVFGMKKTLYEALKGIGYSCCSQFKSSSADRNCDPRLVSCNNPYGCLLYRYPRIKTGRIAYQIVRLVNEIPF